MHLWKTITRGPLLSALYEILRGWHPNSYCWCGAKTGCPAFRAAVWWLICASTSVHAATHNITPDMMSVRSLAITLHTQQSVIIFLSVKRFQRSSAKKFGVKPFSKQERICSFTDSENNSALSGNIKSKLFL